MSSTNEHFVQGADLVKSLPLVPTQSLAKSLPTLGYSLSYGWLKQAGIYPESCTHEAYIQPVDAATELITALAPCIYSKRLKYASLGKLVADCCQLGTGPIHGTHLDIIRTYTDPKARLSLVVIITTIAVV
ncbi:uncharacterized protein BO96DRAFT_327890 [Aspergillus niger CBS 101883]|uniref:Uncharacterized protein n=2 Tax=Aspergillus niger TaxID=5061 RepID=A2QUV1_ASPNC|nr:uncharacterized protein BO96DRAFT_327890 [Aspergillus niger CBS 101883]XP_059601488.1 hypothetical protein An09g06880 [Aspergillus niger]PYH60714.1 hypothetical protein BO96DRAFT_327890 [Aspergillus niger CBS 101883]CAK40481.1 hypothetical protein An09g06880 [Aspergillus niger]